MLESSGILVDLVIAEDPRFMQQPDALVGGGRLQPLSQGEKPYGSDQGEDASVLQVHARGYALPRPLRAQPAEQTESDVPVGLGLKHRLKNAGFFLHERRDVIPQLPPQREIPAGGVEVEENIAQLHLERASLLEPAQGLVFPLGDRFAPQRVRGHDVAITQGKADGVEIPGQQFLEPDEVVVDLVVPLHGIVFEDDAVVLNPD